jgi:hypothetical protein
MEEVTAKIGFPGIVVGLLRVACWLLPTDTSELGASRRGCLFRLSHPIQTATINLTGLTHRKNLTEGVFRAKPV